MHLGQGKCTLHPTCRCGRVGSSAWVLVCYVQEEVDKDLRSELQPNLAGFACTDGAKALLTEAKGSADKRHPAQRCNASLTSGILLIRFWAWAQSP